MSQTNNIQPLRGWVSKFFITSAGQKLGPYYARCWKVNGKLRKQYVKGQDLARTMAACDAYRERQRHRSQRSRELNRIIANLSYLRRMEKRSRAHSLRPEDHAHLERIEAHGPIADGRPKLWTRTRKTEIPQKPNHQSKPHLTARKPERLKFMYPSNKSSLQTFLENIWTKARQEQFRKETPAQKWSRWRSDQKCDRLLPHIIVPPPSIDAEELDGTVRRTCRLIEEAINRGRCPNSSWLPKSKWLAKPSARRNGEEGEAV